MASFPIKNQNYFGLYLMQGWGAQRNLWKRINVCYHIAVIEHVYYDKPPTGGYNYIKIEPYSYFSFSYLF
jgi:hypothetical protein